MEFKKREIKKHKVPRPEMPPEMLEEQEQYSFENKMLIVSVICEPFELTDINEIENTLVYDVLFLVGPDGEPDQFHTLRLFDEDLVIITL